MNMKVSTRVFGGFAIILTIILINSIFGWRNLSTIESSNQKTIQVALPTVAMSNEVKLSLLNVSKQVLEAYHERAIDYINQKENASLAQNEKIEKHLKSLKRTTQGSQTLTNAVDKVEVAFSNYTQQNKTLFNELRNRTRFRTDTIEKRDEIEEYIDSIASYILDISDFDDISSNQTVMTLESQGIALEESVISLFSRIQEYSNTTSLRQAETMKSELDIFIKAANEKLQAFENQSDKLEADHPGIEVIDEVSGLFAELLDLLQANSIGVVALHQQHLQSSLNSTEELAKSDRQLEQTNSDINTLLSLSQKQADITKAAVTDAVSDGQLSVIAIVVISMAIAAIVAVFTARAISLPLAQVNQILNVVSSGDLTQRLEENTKNEFGELAANCNNLIDNLTSLISAIASRSEQLATASEQTSTVTEQTTRAIGQQKSEIAQIATATTELSSTSEQMLNNANQSLQQIENANQDAENVRKISLENKATILSLADEVQQASDVINKLHKDSNDIGSILDVIRGIAEQTNLLALNAAIEAARAGEQGRGFAVVADEVRTLASRTQESTQEIQNMIELLQSGAEQAVTVMQQGQKQTKVCVEQSEKAVTALDSIGQSVASANNMSQQIEESAKEQNMVSQQVSSKLENIVAIAEQTSSGAEQTADSSHAVAKLAEELKSSISQFKV